MKNEFGRFIESKRKEKGITLRKFADLIGIAPAYMSDLEKGHRPPTKNMDILNAIALRLNLTETEKQTMFDYAKNDGVSPDLPDYIMSEAIPNVRVALRMARDFNADNKVWQEVIDILEARKRNGGK